MYVIKLKNFILGRHKSKKGEIYHKGIYDFRLLKKMLKSTGFKKIRRFDWRKIIEFENYDDYTQAYLPHMDKEKGFLMSHNIEAVK